MRDRTLALLFRRYRERGDGRALAAVFDATSRELLDVACHLVRDPAAAEDLVQTTFLAALQRAEHYDASLPLRAWLSGILWREAAKQRRQDARRVDPRRLVEREEPDPAERLAGAEVPEAVTSALRQLPTNYREVLEPLLLEGKRADHIARDLERSPGTVRSQIHRGLEQLRRALPPRLASFSGLLMSPTRGLDDVRAEVFRASGVSPATVAGAASVPGLVIGGVVVSKTVLVAVAAVPLALIGTWFALSETSSGPSAAAEVASASERVPSDDPRGVLPTSTERAPAVAEGSNELDSESSAEARPSFEDTLLYWLGRFAEAPDNVNHGLGIAGEIAKLPPDDASAIMAGVWPHLTVRVKEQVFKPFVFHGGELCALKVLHLGATDAAPSVQSRAFGYLKDYAFQDFALDYEAYSRWASLYKDEPLARVLVANAERFVAELSALSPMDLGERVKIFGRLDLRPGEPAGVDLAAVMRNAGGLLLIEKCLANPDPDVRDQALEWADHLQPDQSWLTHWVIPAIQYPDPDDPYAVNDYLLLLDRPECAWSREIVLDCLRRTSQGSEQRVATSIAAMALAGQADPVVIPDLIEILLLSGDDDLNHDIGYSGLSKLTGVTWQKSYDGEWWLQWWERNRNRFSPEVAARDIHR